MAELLLRMRTPLSRIELAASRLARDATTPTRLDLAHGISDAVSELDEAIAGGLRGLVSDGAGAAEVEDCRAVLEDLRERLTPLLLARSIEWEAEPAGAAEPVPGDPDATRRAALALLRTGSALAGPGGAVALSFAREHEGRRRGIALEVKRGSDETREGTAAAARNDLGDGVRALQDFVLAHGGAFETSAQGLPYRAVLWIDAGDAACDP